MPSIQVHYDEHGRVERLDLPGRGILRIVLIVVAVVVVLWLIGFIISYGLFSAGGEIPGTGTGDVITTPAP